MLYPEYSVKMTGFAGSKLVASYQNRILAQDVDPLIAPFRNRQKQVAGSLNSGANGSHQLYWPIFTGRNWF
jgi:hypothetical protein